MTIDWGRVDPVRWSALDSLQKNSPVERRSDGADDDEGPDSYGLSDAERRKSRDKVRQTPGWLSHGVVDRDASVLRQLHRTQARLYLEAQRAITARLAPGRAKGQPNDAQLASLWAGMQLATDAELRAQLREIDVFLARTTEGALKVAKIHDAAAGSLDDEQLELTMRQMFIRCSYSFTEEEWALLDRVRASKKALGGRAAGQVARHGVGALAHGREMRPDELQLLRPGDRRRKDDDDDE